MPQNGLIEKEVTMSIRIAHSLRLAAVIAVAAGLAGADAEAASLSPLADANATSAVLAERERSADATFAADSAKFVWPFEITGANTADARPAHAAIPLFLSSLIAVGVISRRARPEQP